MIHFSTLEGLLSVLMEVIQNLHITEVEECRKFVRRTENYPHIAECQNSFDIRWHLRQTKTEQQD